MRNLTKKQKTLLKEWFDKHYDGGYVFKLADEMDMKDYEKIDDLHPTEIYYQNVNHYLEGLALDYQRGNRI